MQAGRKACYVAVTERPVLSMRFLRKFKNTGLQGQSLQTTEGIWRFVARTVLAKKAAL